ncbi:hypothetical protein DPEC_G00339790 [Dallia pectoralis]|uniref:Uncharacterized protein n=1 Tax=Dallia pectoralis TaxID=75939 RepID=A0ACC2F4X0_DALPE|nr:hypothetical protein DPEC_G00339790 [Dallia pectoralis]
MIYLRNTLPLITCLKDRWSGQPGRGDEELWDYVVKLTNSGFSFFSAHMCYVTPPHKPSSHYLPPQVSCGAVSHAPPTVLAPTPPGSSATPPARSWGPSASASLPEVRLQPNARTVLTFFDQSTIATGSIRGNTRHKPRMSRGGAAEPEAPEPTPCRPGIRMELSSVVDLAPGHMCHWRGRQRRPTEHICTSKNGLPQHSLDHLEGTEG